MYPETEEYLKNLERELRLQFQISDNLALSNFLDHFLFEVWADGFEKAVKLCRASYEEK